MVSDHTSSLVTDYLATRLEQFLNIMAQFQMHTLQDTAVRANQV